MHLTVIRRTVRVSKATLTIPTEDDFEKVVVALRDIIELHEKGFRPANASFRALRGIKLEFDKEVLVEEVPEKLEGVGERKVEDLGLSVRAYNCLKDANINTVSELLQKSTSDLLKTKRFGRKAMAEIEEVVAGMGLSLRKEA